MKLLALAAVARRGPAHIERIPASRRAALQPLIKRRPTSRFVLVEDLDHLYRTGESRQILELRWAR